MGDTNISEKIERALSKERKVSMLKQMVLIRKFEVKVKSLYNQGKIVGAIHLYIGEEACAVGVCQALRDSDYVFSTHRGHGHAIAKGSDVNRIMAELFGKDTGLSRGHGGSMHLFDIDRGLMGGNGIVGGGIPLALGAAFSACYRETDQVSVAFFSDGAANQGNFGESLNLATLWKLPVIFVCENNCYAATTPVKLSFARQDIAARAMGYGLPGVSVNGNNVIDVYDASFVAVERARSGEGPSLIECNTYRIEPHCGIIPDQREKGERESWVEKDPIDSFKNSLLKDGVITTKEVSEIEKETVSLVEKAVEFAVKSPWPNIDAIHNKSWVL